MKRTPLLRKTPLARSAIKRKRVRPRRHGSPCSWRPCRSLYAPVVVSETERYCASHGMRIADTLVSLLVRARDGECVSCEGVDGGLEWAHILTRACRYVRWDLDNAVTLCKTCHNFYTENPDEWHAFVDRHFPGLWTRLVHREIAGERAGGSVDVAEVIRSVREAAA